MIDDAALTIYTDGSMYGSPRRGGIGFLFVYNNDTGDEIVQEFQPLGYVGATGNQMEIKACIESLKEAQKHPRLALFSRIIVRTDSQHVRDCVPKALFEWPNTKWQKRSGGPVLNARLWRELTREIKRLMPIYVDFEWVKGHAENKHNKAADKLAKKSAKGILRKPLAVVNVAKKTTSEQVQVGCVKMRSQRIKIQIISSERLPMQRVWKYKYQVTSKGSKYFNMVDLIFSLPNPDLVLSRWHNYLISVNNDTGNPTIMKVLKELGT